MVEVLLMDLMVAHAADMSSAVLENIHGCALASTLYIVGYIIGVAMGTIWDGLIIYS